MPSMTETSLIDKSDSTWDRTGRYLLGTALLIPLAIGLAAWLWGRPWMTSDTSTGLLAWFDWRNGGPWNCVMIPDPANIANSIPAWVSWWSPGQYVWPGFFISLGLSIGGSMLVSAVIAAWIRSIGFYLFLQTLGCSKRAAGLAALIEAGNWQLFYSFGLYTGGEVLQAAWLPWLLLSFSALRSHNLCWWLCTLPILFFASIFAKHSMWFVLLAGSAWLIWEEWLLQPRNWTHFFGRATAIALAFASTRFLSNHWLTHNGPTPGMLGADIHPTLLNAAYPIAAPALGAIGIGSVFGRVFFLMGANAENGWQQFLPVLLIVALVGIISYGLLLKQLPHCKLARLLGLFLAVYIGGFAVLFAGQASVSMEERHFRPVAMLLIAGLAAIIYDLRGKRRLWHISMNILACGIVFYGLATCAQRIWHLHAMNHVGPAGVTLPDVSQTTIAELRRLDASNVARGGVVFLPDPSLSLEMPLSRKISTDAQARPLSWFTQRTWRGRVPLLTVLVPENWATDPRLTALLECFTDYAPVDWKRHTVDGWLFFTAETPASTQRSSL